MKLIIQSDDFGCSDGVTYGIVKGIKKGGITCTGLFVNMPEAAEAVELVKNMDVCLGIDINYVCGRPVSDPSKIPSLVNEQGEFYRSRELMEMDKLSETGSHIAFEDCVREVEAQVCRFIELVGKRPDYMQGHSYDNNITLKAKETVAAKYDIKTTQQFKEEFNIHYLEKLWYQKKFDTESQMNCDPMSCIKAKDNGFSYGKDDINFMGIHAGFVDEELIQRSSFNIVRAKDLYAVCSEEFKVWMKENNVKLISYNDLVKKH